MEYFSTVIMNDLPFNGGLDYKLYQQGKIHSPNCILGKFIILDYADVKSGHKNTVEEVAAYLKEPFVIKLASQYVQE